MRTQRVLSPQIAGAAIPVVGGGGRVCVSALQGSALRPHRDAVTVLGAGLGGCAPPRSLCCLPNPQDLRMGPHRAVRQGTG